MVIFTAKPSRLVVVDLAKQRGLVPVNDCGQGVPRVAEEEEEEEEICGEPTTPVVKTTVDRLLREMVSYKKYTTELFYYFGKTVFLFRRFLFSCRQKISRA